MILSVSGSRKPLLLAQRDSLLAFLLSHRPTEIHGSDFQGACEETFEMAIQYLPDTARYGYLPHGNQKGISVYQAHRKDYHHTYPATDYYAQVRATVNPADALLAIPVSTRVRETGLPWYAVRYAHFTDKQVYYIWPDGRVEKEEGYVL